MKDSTLSQTTAMPNAGNTKNTNTIALPQRGVRPFTSGFRVRLFNGLGTGANSKNITYKVYGSNESNGANAVAVSKDFVVAGNATKHPVSSREIALPPEMDKSYIFGSATGEADGGNAADAEFGLEIII
jgi:hypothetical protein